MKLRSFTLQIFNPEQTLAFYTNILGFAVLDQFSENNTTYYNLGFKNTDFYIQLKHTPSLKKIEYQEKTTDNYWKYSLFVDDIQKVYRNLKEQNYHIGEPFQFGDIGYLSHTTDNENHKIELIRKTFQQNKLLQTKEECMLGLLTIRTKDPIKIIKLYEDILDLKLFVRMYVNRGKGFTLYFLGHKDLQVPSPDIDAIENREWMYQQSHLFIEIQHYWNSEYNDDFFLDSSKENGLQTINFTGNLDILKKRLIANKLAFQENGDKITFETIDHHTIVLTQS